MGVESESGQRCRGVFLSWTIGDRRSAELAKLLGLEDKHVVVGTQRSATAPLRWLVQGALSIPVLLRRQTSAIVLMMPPYPALLLCRTVARLRRIPLVVDAHSAVFEDRRWQRFLPSTLRHFQNCDLVIVTNSVHRELLESHGIAVSELHHPPMPVERRKPLDPAGPLLVPASWHVDEPIVEIVNAARARPDRKFVITGRPTPASRKRIEPVPPNVQLVGYVSDDEYADLLAGSAAVCSLTLNDNTMQMGGYEAMSLGTPLVTSNFSLLQEYFGDAAEFAEPTAGSIGSALDRLFADHPGYARRMVERRAELLVTYQRSLDPVCRAISI